MSNDYSTGEGQKQMFYENMGFDRESAQRRLNKSLSSGGDHGCDPLGDGKFRMVPSGDIVGRDEKERRLGR